MSRNRLHINKVEDFKSFLTERDWAEVETKGIFEVFRMTHTDNPALIVHQKMDAKVHLTLHGEAEYWFSKYLRERKKL